MPELEWTYYPPPPKVLWKSHSQRWQNETIFSITICEVAVNSILTLNSYNLLSPLSIANKKNKKRMLPIGNYLVAFNISVYFRKRRNRYSVFFIRRTKGSWEWWFWTKCSSSLCRTTTCMHQLIQIMIKVYI